MCLHCLLDRSRHPLEPPDPIDQQRVLTSEMGDRVGAAIGHDLSDLVKPEPELAVEEDPLQPVEIGVAIPAVAGSRPLARAEQADLVVVVQRPHGDARHAGHRAHGVTHGAQRRPSRYVRVKRRRRAMGAEAEGPMQAGTDVA